MKIFHKTPTDWESKINFVDVNNRAVGFDMAENCCEDFGCGVASSIDSAAMLEKGSYDAEPYSFVDEDPTHMDGFDCGGYLFFRIVADGLPDLYVVIWNHHNGYYSHGFDSWRTSGSL